MNLKHTSISNLLLLPKSHKITSHVGEIQAILKRHKVFRELYKLEQSIQPILISMEETGLVIAEEWFGRGLEGKRIKLRDAIDEINKYIDGLGSRIDKSALVSYWNENGLPPTNSFEGLSMYRELHPTYSLMLKYKRHQSYLKQWGTKLKVDGTKLDENLLLRGQWKSFSSYSGRITAKRLPLTSMPSAMRDYVVAPKAFKIVSLDMSNAELRFLSYFANCKSLISKFNEGEDIHKETATLIQQGISGGYVVDDKTARELAKRYTYSFLYGASKRTITENLQKVFPQITSAVVSDINDEFTNQYPEIQKFLLKREECKQLLTPFGAVEPIAIFKQSQKRNFTLQSSVSIAIKILMKVVHKQEITVVHILHDEVWILVPSSYSVKTLVETITKEFKTEIQNIFPGFPDRDLLAVEKIGGKNNGKNS